MHDESHNTGTSHSVTSFTSLSLPQDPMQIASMSDIHHESQLAELSVRELKIILQANCINYKGCIEKKELLEKVVRLWHTKREEKSKEGRFSG